MFKLVSEEKKDILFSQKSKLKKCQHKIYINEDLTRTDSAIFRRARKEFKEGKLHSVWTRKGLVWAKLSEEGKPFVIKE
jgi:hypothetical protein